MCDAIPTTQERRNCFGSIKAIEFERALERQDLAAPRVQKKRLAAVGFVRVLSTKLSPNRSERTCSLNDSTDMYMFKLFSADIMKLRRYGLACR